MEIRPGIHQVPGLKWSNAYLLVEDQGLTLIDGGIPGDGSKILRYISQLGHAPQYLTRIVLTHSHPDHSGPMKELSRISGATIAVHEKIAGTSRRPAAGGYIIPANRPRSVGTSPSCAAFRPTKPSRMDRYCL